MAEKFIPAEKMSKAAKKELAKARRGSWGALNPVTRKPPNPKAYNRKKARYDEGFHDTEPFIEHYYGKRGHVLNG